jgi:hypothetical protein
MSSEKSVPVNFRVSPYVKANLVAEAAAENRSLTNMREMLIISHCERTGFQRRATAGKQRGATR